MTMTMSQTLEQIRQALEQVSTDCAMEDIVGLCPDLTWNQVFLAIDYLSRTGQVRVTLDRNKTYRVQATRIETEEHSNAAITGEVRGGKATHRISRSQDHMQPH